MIMKLLINTSDEAFEALGKFAVRNQGPCNKQIFAY